MGQSNRSQTSNAVHREPVRPRSLQAAETPLLSRSKYIRTDATTPYSGFPPPNWIIFNAPSDRFFATDTFLNHLNVVDAKERRLVGTLVIPGAFGLDQAPDGKVLYVGTVQGDLFVVDPVNLRILGRYPTSKISAYGFPAQAVYALANGKLLLERVFLVDGYSWIDGNGPLALWDPNDNSIIEFGANPVNNGGIPEKKI